MNLNSRPHRYYRSAPGFSVYRALCTALVLNLASALISAVGLAAPPAKTVAPADDISAPARSAKSSAHAPAAPTTAVKSSPDQSADKVLWDHWYTVTINKVVHYEYYNDRAEIKKGRILFQNHAWKQEEDYINEEQLGVFAENNAALTPLFYNFHSTYRSLETTIDGTVKDGRELSVRIRKGGTELPVIKKSVPPKTFFSVHFPLWLGRHLREFKPGQIYPFQTILEDNLEAEFSTINGQVRIEPTDEVATQTHTLKLTVNYRELKSIWWVDSDGVPVRIEMPQQKTVVRSVPKETALKFLDESGN